MTDNANHHALYDAMLQAVRALYDERAVLSRFANLPEEMPRQQITPATHPSRSLFETDDKLVSHHFADLQKALLDASPAMAWRTIYQPSGKPDDHHDYGFAERLGCYVILGKDGPFACPDMTIFLVYMPAGTLYPWHTHPAEELYFMISGNAIFKRGDKEDVILSEGQSMFHSENQPHAIETTNNPMLSLAIWRNHLDTPPLLIDHP